MSRTAEMTTSDAEPGWRVIVDAIVDPVIVLDPKGMILHHNPAVADLYPRVRIGIHLSALLRIPELLKAIDQARSSGQPCVVQVQDRVPVIRRHSAIVTPISLDEPGNTGPALLITLRDLTDQEKHATMRTDFIANASHELRTPLASLIAIVETLQGAARTDEAARDRFLALMTAQTARMSQLIDDLLSLSRAEMKAHVPPRAVVDLPDLLEWVTQSLEPVAQASNARLTLQHADDADIRVRGERDELAQVFLNLMENAIKYGGVPGQVDIRVATSPATDGQPRQVHVSVHDNGIGIAAEHIPRLTERFYRVNVAASREKGGTGLGLAIVKYIVTRHRGELSIRSRLGDGSVFTITLPCM